MDRMASGQPERPGFGAPPGVACMLMVLVLASTGCSDIMGIGEDRVESNFDTWRSERPALYQFTYQPVCFCLRTEPVVVTVDGDSVIHVGVEYGDGSPPGTPSDYFTVDGLFEQIREWRDRDPYREELEFHHRLGYPTEVFFDFEKNVADEEMGFRVRDLQAVERFQD